MSWWKTALYDTCSLITFDKLLQDSPSLSRWFPKKLLALEVCLSADQMYVETAKRVVEFVELCDLPTPTELAKLLSSSGLSIALSEADIRTNELGILSSESMTPERFIVESANVLARELPNGVVESVAEAILSCSAGSLRAEISRRIAHHHHRDLALAFVDRWRTVPKMTTERSAFYMSNVRSRMGNGCFCRVQTSPSTLSP